MIFVRPCRSATVRTRLDAGGIQERLSVLVNDRPQGLAWLRAHGTFVGGRVEAKEFTVDYKFNNFKNPQTYAIHGRLEETGEWRILRLRLTAHSPWMSRFELFGLAAVMFFVYIFGRGNGGGALIGFFLVLIGFYAFANLLYIPSSVNRRVAAMVARQIDGDVQRGDAWLAP